MGSNSEPSPVAHTALSICRPLTSTDAPRDTDRRINNRSLYIILIQAPLLFVERVILSNIDKDRVAAVLFKYRCLALTRPS